MSSLIHLSYLVSLYNELVKSKASVKVILLATPRPWREIKHYYQLLTLTSRYPMHISNDMLIQIQIYYTQRSIITYTILYLDIFHLYL